MPGEHRYQRVRSAEKRNTAPEKRKSAAAAPADAPVSNGAAADDEFVVEAVLDSRPAGSTVEYLVKWLGFGPSENTWEPAAHLHGCIQLKEFKQAQKQPKKKAKKESAPAKQATAPHKVGDLVDVDRRFARDGGPAKIVELLAGSIKVKYLCGGHETVQARFARPLSEPSITSPRRRMTAKSPPLVQKRKQPPKKMGTAAAAATGEGRAHDAKKRRDPEESAEEDQPEAVALEQKQPQKKTVATASATATALVGARSTKKRHTAEEPAEEDEPEVVTVTAGREKRKRKSTTMNVGGQAVLKLNNYSMEDGEPTLSGGQLGAGPTKPKGATSAFMFFSKDLRAAVANLPFIDRQARLGELWRETKLRSKYEAMAEKDHARFVKETAAYETAREEHEAALVAAKEQAEQAEWQALQAEDARRIKLAAEREAKKAVEARKPAKERKLSDIQRALQESNISMKSELESVTQARSAFIMHHADALRPFVLPSVLEQESHKPLQPGALQPTVTETPKWIHGEMRGYQLEGLTWLLQQYNHGVGAILGDEMGLGKTLQTIAFLSSLKHMKNLDGPFLVVCPMSVLSSWMTEFRRWCPSFRTIKLHSADAAERDRMRKTILPDVGSYDCIVTTYEMVKSDKFNNSLNRIHFRYLVIDEGHIVKNELTLISKTLRKLHFSAALLLTGTPLQNNMHELWALLNFLFPYIFPEGSSKSFDSAFNLTNSKVDDDMLSQCHYMLRPFILRRIKADVEKSVPPKEEIKVFCPLSEMQQFWYKSLLMRETKLLQKGVTAVERGEETETKTQYQQLNNLLMHLRKCVCHPFLFDGVETDPDETSLEELVDSSGKLAILAKLLPKLQSAGHRVVMFSQFTSMLDILEDFLRMSGYQYCRLDGSTNRVQRTVDISSFNAKDSPYFIFLMSTRAGGLGVNLQTADTAILFDSDWNPQADLQAMARVHRIGQTKKVHVYRMVTRGTVEERIIQRAEKKLYLDQMVNRGSTAQAEKLEKLGTDALMKMLTFGADKILSADNVDEGLSDADLDRLIDRSDKPAASTVAASASAADGNLETGVTQTAADFKPELPMLMTQTLQGTTYERKSMQDLNREWAQITGKRSKKSRLVQYGQHQVLKVNDYELGHNLSVFDAEQKGADMATKKKSGRQIAGRDYQNESHCLSCWDGGDIVMCDFCPASYHPTCLGFKDAEEMTGGSTMGWSCPHHSCDDCGRKAAAAGGLLFRCSVCPSAFCEDHLPLNTPIVNKCARFLALGQRHPQQACFVLCSSDCTEFSKKPIVTELENGTDQKVIVGAAAGIRAGASGPASASASGSASASALAPSAAQQGMCVPSVRDDQQQQHQQHQHLLPMASPAASPTQSPAMPGVPGAASAAAAGADAAAKAPASLRAAASAEMPTPSLKTRQQYRTIYPGLVRAGYTRDSEQLGVLEVGSIIDVLSVTMEQGLQRVRFKCGDGMDGWTSVVAADGQVILEPLI